MAKKLSTMFVTRAKQGRYGDGNGLYLQVKDSGARAWALRYERQGCERWMGLGSAEFVSLAMAREKAFEARRLLRQGVDPIEARKAAQTERRLAALKTVTFAECATRFAADRGAEWRNAKHRRDWLSTLERYAFPVFGNLPVARIDTPLVLRVLEPIWIAKAGTARKIRQRIEAVLDWARVREYRGGDNPARLSGHLKHLLPQRGKLAAAHHAALAIDEVPAFMAELRTLASIPARALEFLILTASRASEVRGARWQEFDLAANVWVVPAERVKSAREHRVPLGGRALEILASLPRSDEFVFPGGKGGPMYVNGVYYALRDMGRGDITVHGFRSTFRDWGAERTAYPNHVLEQALAHAIPNAVEAAYRRSDLFEKRRRLMAEWAEYCNSSPAERGGAVVTMRSA